MKLEIERKFLLKAMPDIPPTEIVKIDQYYFKNLSGTWERARSWDSNINGKSYTLFNNSGNIITQDYKKIIPNMGLTRDSHVGELIIQFNVEFPKSLTEETMNKLKEIL